MATPFLNVTRPVTPAGSTVAVKVTGSPTTLGVFEVATLAVVGACSTVWLTAVLAEVL